MNLLLLIAALVFTCLAYDAWKLSVPADKVPYSVTADDLGQPLDGIPLMEQSKRKDWNSRYGLGDLSQTFWLWTILALACAIGAVAGLVG
ncbi:hypothetical protein RQP54_01670 [Curvibacter sp. APW13]|uniref:hypothetical protein n=1 Tax=Curvibacter sp. APW13 TaxID=3077236 RepID=UPI0028E0685F|nr:hypothetical protein [Curvibacter sp. APW13]MDT8989564.1 hypothetical protein [Curvibacter sp. APW13]